MSSLGRDSERYKDLGTLCFCGMKLLGDMEKDVWVCDGCLQEENDCDCEPEDV